MGFSSYNCYQVEPTDLNGLPEFLEGNREAAAVAICRDLLQAEDCPALRRLWVKTVSAVEPDMLPNGRFSVYDPRALNLLPVFEKFGSRSIVAVMGYIYELCSELNLHTLMRTWDEALDVYMSPSQPMPDPHVSVKCDHSVRKWVFE